MQWPQRFSLNTKDVMLCVMLLPGAQECNQTLWIVTCYLHWFFCMSIGWKGVCETVWNLEGWWNLRWNYRLHTQTHNNRSMSSRTNCHCLACQNISRSPNPIDLCLCISVWLCTVCVWVRAKLSGFTLIFPFSLSHLSVLNHLWIVFSPQSLPNQPLCLFFLYTYYIKSRQTVSHPTFMSLHPPSSCLTISYYADPRAAHTLWRNQLVKGQAV